MGNLRVPCAEEVLVQKLKALFDAAQERLGPTQGEEALTFEAFAEALDENDGRVKRLMRTFVTEARRNRQRRRTQPYPLQRHNALPVLNDLPSPHRAVARLRLQYLQRRQAQWLENTNLALLDTSSESSSGEEEMYVMPPLRAEESAGTSEGEGEGEDGPRHVTAYVTRPRRPADY